jgi:hypothetical protein
LIFLVFWVLSIRVFTFYHAVGATAFTRGDLSRVNHVAYGYGEIT